MYYQIFYKVYKYTHTIKIIYLLNYLHFLSFTKITDLPTKTWCHFLTSNLIFAPHIDRV